jgi:hypothetical protein
MYNVERDGVNFKYFSQKKKKSSAFEVHVN